MLNIWKVIPLNHSGVFLANAPIPKPVHRRLQWGTWWEEYLIKLLGDMGLAEDSEDQAGQGFGVCRGSTGGHSRQNSRAKGQHTWEVCWGLRYLRKGRYSINEPGPGERQTQKPGKQSVSLKITWKEFMRKGRRGLVQREEVAYKGVNPSYGTEKHSPHKVWNLNLSSASVQAILPESFRSYNLII